AEVGIRCLIVTGVQTCALPISVWAIRAINASLPPNLLPVPVVHADGVVLAFAVGLTFFTGLIFGIAPACHSAKADVNEVLKNTRSEERRVGKEGRCRAPPTE